MTQILVDLGLRDAIVGRSPWCTAVERSVPVAGDLINVDLEVISRLRPTHITLQRHAGGIDQSLQRIATQRGWILLDWTINTLDDVVDVINAMEAAFREEMPAIEHAADAWRGSIASVRTPDPAVFTGPVLITMPGDPPLVFGQGTYLHDLLEGMGGTNAAVLTGWGQMTLEDITRLNPAALIVVRREDYDVSDPAGSLMQLEIDAVRDGRVVVFAHPDATIPSTRVVEVAIELRSLLTALAEHQP